MTAHHEEPLNTREAHYQALAILRLAAIVGDIHQPERRLCYETGLPAPELRAIDILIRHTHACLNELAEQKTQGTALQIWKPSFLSSHSPQKTRTTTEPPM